MQCKDINGNVFHFNSATAKKFEENTYFDGNNFIPFVTKNQWEHEALYHTKNAAWILEHWSNYQHTSPSYHIIDQDDAFAWMVKNHEPDNVIKKHFPKLMEKYEV